MKKLGKHLGIRGILLKKAPPCSRSGNNKGGLSYNRGLSYIFFRLRRILLIHLHCTFFSPPAILKKAPPCSRSGNNKGGLSYNRGLSYKWNSPDIGRNKVSSRSEWQHSQRLKHSKATFWVRVKKCWKLSDFSQNIFLIGKYIGFWFSSSILDSYVWIVRDLKIIIIATSLLKCFYLFYKIREIYHWCNYWYSAFLQWCKFTSKWVQYFQTHG